MSDRVFANVADPAQIVVIDPELRLERALGVPDVIWHDSARDRVIVATGDPGVGNPGTRTPYALLPQTCEAVIYSEEGPS